MQDQPCGHPDKRDINQEAERYPRQMALSKKSNNGEGVFLEPLHQDTCEGCLMVGCDHGPQAEVAQGVGPGPLVEH